MSRHTDQRQFTMTVVMASAIATALAWFFLEQLVASLPAKGIDILTSSFTITWRPLMRCIGIAALTAALQGFLAELQGASQVAPDRLSLVQLRERIADFESAGRVLREWTLHDLAAGNAGTLQIQRLNRQLLDVGSNWLDPAGIPGRPWFQHVLYAARYTYEHLEFPGLTEAVEAANWPLAAEQAQVLDAALLKNTDLLKSATSDWRGEHTR